MVCVWVHGLKSPLLSWSSLLPLPHFPLTSTSRSLLVIMSEHDDSKVPTVEGAADANARQKALAHLANDEEAMRASYGKASLKAIVNDRYAFGCSLFAAMGGLLFGIDQGLVSVILVMPKFLERFHQIDGTKDVSAGFHKGESENLAAAMAD